MHLATGSSAGTVKDTWVSARINSFTILWAEHYTGPGKLFVRIQPLILILSFFHSLSLTLPMGSVQSRSSEAAKSYCNWSKWGCNLASILPMIAHFLWSIDRGDICRIECSRRRKTVHTLPYSVQDHSIVALSARGDRVQTNNWGCLNFDRRLYTADPPATCGQQRNSATVADRWSVSATPERWPHIEYDCTFGNGMNYTRDTRYALRVMTDCSARGYCLRLSSSGRQRCCCAYDVRSSFCVCQLRKCGEGTIKYSTCSNLRRNSSVV